MSAQYSPLTATGSRKQKASIAVGILLVITLATFLHLDHSSSTSSSLLNWSSSSSTLGEPPLEGIHEIGDNLHLTHDQCQVIFPKLYHEADRAAKWTKARGGITLADLDKADEKGSARIMIWKNKVRPRVLLRASLDPDTRT
jgi:hypothetical protein